VYLDGGDPSTFSAVAKYRQAPTPEKGKSKCAKKRKEAFMKPEFAIAEVKTGQLNALVKNLMGQMEIDDPNEAVRRVNSGEWAVCEVKPRWQEKNGVIFFTLPVTDGRIGEEWIKHLERKGFRVSDYAKSVLRSPDFKPTSGVTYRIAVLKGMLFQDSDRVTKKIRAEANRRKLSKPNAEVVCLIRDNFSDKEIEAMGLWWIVAMHDPIKDSDGVPLLLVAFRGGGGQWLGTAYGRLGRRWHRGFGFAFVLP